MRSRTIQIGLHIFPSIREGIEMRYCRIAKHLSVTHRLAFRSMFAWERWVNRRTLSNSNPRSPRTDGDAT